MLNRILIFALVLSVGAAVLLLARGGNALEPGVAELVSLNSGETASGNGNSSGALISANGRVIVYDSVASDIAPTDTNGSTDVFARDLETGTTHVVSINSAGTDTGESSSNIGGISATGRYVAFTSNSNDLVATDGNGLGDVFVRDLVSGTTTLVSVNTAGTDSGNVNSRNPAISADGRYVAFESYANDLVSTDTNGTLDVFVRDLVANTTTLISTNSAGTDSADGLSRFPEITPDGQHVVFESFAVDIAPTDTNGSGDIFVRHLSESTPELVSVNKDGSDTGNAQSAVRIGISSNGRYVSFESDADDLVATDTNGERDVFLRDLDSGTTELVSANAAGTDSGNDSSISGAMSSDGARVAFFSYASDFGPTDTNGFRDTYVRDRDSGITILVSANSAGADSAEFGGSIPQISDNGAVVSFDTTSTDVVAGLSTPSRDVFIRSIDTGMTTMVSINQSGTAGGDDQSRYGMLSSDGTTVAFWSDAGDLVPQNTNNVQNIFAFTAAPDVAIVKDDGDQPVDPGSTLVYQLSYSNGTTADATGVVIEETVPDNATFDNTDSTPGWLCSPNFLPGSVCTFEIGPLFGGDADTIDFAVFVGTAPGITQIVNTVTISDDGLNGDDQNLANNESTTITPVLGASPGPTQTPTPGPSATPTATPEPTGTPGPTASPTPTPTGGPQLTQGDNDCDGDEDAVDALKTLQEIAALDYAQQAGCPEIGGAVPAGVGPTIFGDLDCDDDVDAVDALKLLQHIAAIPFTQSEPCTNIGDSY